MLLRDSCESVADDAADAYVASGGGGLVLNNTGAVLKGGTNSGITVTPTQTTIVGNYKYVQSIGTVSNATPILINFPVQTGLYTLLMGTTSTDPFSVNSCVSVNAYFLSGTGFVSGGNVSAVLNGTLGGNEYAQFYTNSNQIYFRYVAGSTATITNMFCRVVQLTGDLGF